MYKEFGISDEIIKISNEVEQETNNVFKNIDKVVEYNSLKVIKAFQKNNLSEMHFNVTTGYGYDDIGRDTTERIFADIFKAEDSLVRNQLVSGTHALTVTLFGLLRPQDTLLSIAGKPYDTLDEVIGIKENGSSLKSFGVNYEQVELVNNDFDYDKIKDIISRKKIKLITVQRSRGYANRDSISIEKLKEVIDFIKSIDSKVIIMVDNCYCEFVSTKEPIEIGADIAVRFINKKLRWWNCA